MNVDLTTVLVIVRGTNEYVLSHISDASTRVQLGALAMKSSLTRNRAAAVGMCPARRDRLVAVIYTRFRP